MTQSLKLILYFLLSIYIYPIEAKINDARVLKINIFGSSNGKGLEISRRILTEALVKMGHVVFEKEFNDDKIPKHHFADINIFFEIINPKWIPFASVNWFIPHPECYAQELALLNRMNLILCCTHEGERIFKSLGKRTYFLGFSSLDCKLPSINKDYFSYLHLAGGSPLKGTNATIEAWEANLGMPHLTAVIHYEIFRIFQPNLKYINEKLPIDELRYLQNTCGVHLCLSETEGFGHYLMEGMSTSAVVIATDAPPMNEFIVDKRCLVSYKDQAPCRLATRYFVDADLLRATVQNLMFLSHEELKEIGEKNRLMYLQKTQEFQENLVRLLHEEFNP